MEPGKPPSEAEPTSRALQSWKAIGAYLHVTARSAQRWEKDLGLPVRRQGSGRNARVYAYPAEMDSWLARGALAQDGGEGRPRVEVRSGDRRRVWIWVALAGILLTGGGLAAGLYTGVVPGARAPHGWVADGFKLRIVDDRERVCWEQRFPEFLTRFIPEFGDRVRIAEVDGDSSVEILFNYNPKTLQQGSLLCFDKRGNLRWKFPYGRSRTVGDRSFDSSYRGHIVRPVRVGGKPHVLTVANHNLWYPAQVALLDARTGRLVDEYWHPGSIYHLAVHDLDGDAEHEVLFGAVNNPGEGLGHAALGILKLPFSRGPKPTSYPGRPLRPLTSGVESAYLLFPHPDVCRAAGMLGVPSQLRIEDQRRILFQTPLPEDGGIMYYYDFRLNLLEFRVSDNFVPLHQRFGAMGLVRHRLTAGERAELGRALPFPAAPDGNSPELNRFWKYQRIP